MRKTGQNLLVIIALALTMAVSGVSTLAGTKADDKKRKAPLPTIGRISVKTTPGNYPILINGKPSGLSGNPNATEIDLPPGTYTVEVLFPNKPWMKEIAVEAGKSNCICLNYKTGSASRACPYEVSMSAPDEVLEGDLVTFASVPSFTDGANPTLNYRWRVTPENAKITGGLGTSSITVDTKGLGDQTVTAELEVGDGQTDANCLQNVRAQTRVRVPVPELPNKFEEFDSRSFDDDKARFDNYAIGLQNRPDVQAYIIVYTGVGKSAANSDRLAARTLDYLVKTRGVDGRRITVINGGFRQRTGYELWIVPPGVTVPSPTPTVVNPGTLPKPRRKK